MTRASPKLDEFAELLACGLSVPAASQAMHVNDARGYRYLAMIRKKLGMEQTQ